MQTSAWYCHLQLCSGGAAQKPKGFTYGQSNTDYLYALHIPAGMTVYFTPLSADLTYEVR